MTKTGRSATTRSSRNVFADLGFPDAADMQAKTKLAMAIARILHARKLKQADAAKLLGVPQPKISQLVNYRLDGFSTGKLMEFLAALNQDVEITIRPRKKAGVGAISVVEAAN